MSIAAMAEVAEGRFIMGWAHRANRSSNAGTA